MKGRKYQPKQLKRNQNTKEIRKDLDDLASKTKKKMFFAVCKDKCNMISKSLKESDER